MSYGRTNNQAENNGLVSAVEKFEKLLFAKCGILQAHIAYNQMGVNLHLTQF